MREFQCSAILFDLDGVLVDSTRSVDRQWRKWATEMNIDPDEVVRIAHGVRTIEVVRRLAPHLDEDAEVLRLEKREAEDQDGVAVMAGAVDLLASIPSGRWAVVTSGTRYLATSRLRVGKLPSSGVLVSADDVTRGKPDPEPYLKGAQLLGMNPVECVVVEDAPAGIRAARAAGMKAIGLTSTYAADKLSEADVVIGSLSEIEVRDGMGTGAPLTIAIR
jgi:mannitol-1-/sugar-/sorbitol-6-phosphatase